MIDMRKFGKLALSGLLCMTLAGCSSSGSMLGSSYRDDTDKILSGSFSDNGSFSDWSSGASSNSVKADYNYYLSASGNTDKGHDDMIADFEKIEDFVESNGGFISDVYNNYTGNGDDYYYSYYDDNDYTEVGHLQFTIQIDESKIDTIHEYMQGIVKENGFTVDSYRQDIQNYEDYEVVDKYDDDHVFGYDNVITQEDLDKALKYSEYTVNLEYLHERSFIGKIGIRIARGFEAFWSGLDSWIITCMALLTLNLVIFWEVKLFYKSFKKMQNKHRMKYPELYPAKHIVVDEQSKPLSDGAKQIFDRLMEESGSDESDLESTSDDDTPVA